MRTLACLASASLALTLLAGTSAGCGSGSNGDGDGNGSGDGGVGDPSNAFSANANGGLDAGSLTACATSQAGATLKPVNLVFLYDKSGSMGDQTRWYTCATGPTPVIRCGFFNVPSGPSPRYICYPDGGEANLAITTGGVIGYNSAACPVGTVAGIANTAICSNPASCTLADAFDPAAKWIPVGAAMNGFFADPTSAGMSASLGFFPKASAQGPTLCQPTDYGTPAVPLSALPNTTIFKNAIAGQKPGGNTPTEVALDGAIAYAKGVAKSHPNDVTAIVLVTDGEPTECASPVGQNISVVRGIAQAAASDPQTPIKTYVIGVGANLTNLNQIASGGGTGTATIVSTTNPTQTSADFQKALEKIRGQALTCDLALPKPPDGKSLDINAVNVVATLGGKEDVLTYNKDCKGGSGWHYDDPNSPKLVQLCPTSCSAIRADSGGKVSIAFGCATKGGVIR